MYLRNNFYNHFILFKLDGSLSGIKSYDPVYSNVQIFDELKFHSIRVTDDN